MQPSAHRRFSEPVELYARALSSAGGRRDRDAALLRPQLLRDRQSEPDHDHSQRHAGRFRPTSRPRKTGGVIVAASQRVSAKATDMEDGMLELYHNINSVC